MPTEKTESETPAREARGPKKFVQLGVGFYLVDGETHKLMRDSNGDILRFERRHQAQVALTNFDPHKVGILEVTANNYAWGE